MFTVPEVTILRLSAIFWHHADPKLCSLVYEYFSKLNFHCVAVWTTENSFWKIPLRVKIFKIYISAFMCRQGTFRFFSRNMKAVHLYLSPSFFMSDCVPCYCLWAFYWPTFLHGWVISPSVALAWNWQCLRFFFAFKCGWKSTWIKKKYLCVCVDVAQTWKKYLKLGGESTLSLPSNFPPRSDRPMVREIAKNQQATSQTPQV